MKDAILAAAEANPDVKFALVDDTFASEGSDTTPHNSRGGWSSTPHRLPTSLAMRLRG